MNTVSDLEKVILSLPAVEREHLATVAWDSLAGNPDGGNDPNIDAEGMEIAAQRDNSLESGQTQAMDQAEFLTRAGLGDARRLEVHAAIDQETSFKFIRDEANAREPVASELTRGQELK